MRINVTGNAGSGKTTLSKLLGAELGLPVFCLDSIVWQPHWAKTPVEDRGRAEAALTARPSWVIDGVSGHVRARADLVVFLDVPRWVCAARCLIRALRYFKRTRPEMPQDCPEVEIVPRLLRLVHRFPAAAGSQIRGEARLDPRRFRIERYPCDTDGLVQEVALLFAEASQ